MGKYALQIEAEDGQHGAVDPKFQPKPPAKPPRRWSGKVVLAAAVIVAAAMLGGSFAYAQIKKHRDADTAFDVNKVLTRNVTIPPSAPSREFTAETIKQYDGKNGHKCYVAVSGVVYQIPQGNQWQGGQHAPSNGQAYCGADMTAAMAQSPHGTSKLQELPKVGTYK